jgi:predicted amidohydrolase YtcJ
LKREVAGRPFADFAITGARIRTFDPSRPQASAVAWRDGTIIAVGSDAEIREVCDAHTEAVDGRGTVLVPGLVDAHFHPLLGAGDTHGGVDLMSCETLDAVCAALAEHKRASGSEWVLGYGLRYSVFPDGHIDGALIEDATGGAPAYLTLYDFHSAVATSRALALAGVTGPVPLPGTSQVVIRDGRLTGELLELPAMELVRSVIPTPTAQERRDFLIGLLRSWNAMGLTALHVMDGTAATFETLRDLEGTDDLTLRMVVAPTVTPDMDADARDDVLRLCGERGSLWRAGAAKFFMDGTVEAGTAWLFEPDVNGEGTLPYWPDPQEYRKATAQFAAAGFQCVTHAIGDRAVREALDAYRDAGHADGVMHRIEHIETVRDEELRRFAPEHVAASMQPVHVDATFDDPNPVWPERLGPERAARAWRYGDLLRCGAVLAFGSDWPVAWADPRRGMASARLRRTPGRPDAPVICPEQALTPEQALAAYTTGPARVAGEADQAGQISVGYRADLTGFVDDPLAVDPDTLLSLPVAITIVAGRIVYKNR